MNAELAPIYLVVEPRTDRKRWRVLAEFADPKAALAHARLLRWAGSPARIVLASTVDESELA